MIERLLFESGFVFALVRRNSGIAFATPAMRDKHELAE